MRESGGGADAVGSAEPPVWRPGDVIDGRYEVTGLLGRGGMGVVHLVHHAVWGTDLVVKSPLPEVVERADGRERFVAEAEAWVSLGMHPHVCACYYVRTLGGVPRVFAEYIAGGSLARWIADGRLYEGSADEVLARLLDIAIQISWGLQHAHDRGLVHQDVKPDNVLLGHDGTAKVTDFGLARARTVAAEPADRTDDATGGLASHAGFGSPAYASPEQAAGQRLGPRSDVFSFAVTVLEMFTGARTWMFGAIAGFALSDFLASGGAAAVGGDDDTGGTADLPTRNGPPPMPEPIADLLAQCLSLEPAERPASAADVAHRLREVHQQLLGRAYDRPEPVPPDLRAVELNNRALSMLDLGREDGADAAFTAALAADPQHLEVTYNSDVRAWRRGLLTDEDVIARLTAFRTDRGDPWQARHLLARVHLERGDEPSARSLLDALVHEHPDEPEIAETRVLLDRLRSERTTRRARGTGPGRTVVEDAVPVPDVWTFEWRKSGPHRSPRQPRRLFPPENTVHLSADARSAIVAGKDGAVGVWDLRSGERRHVWSGHGAPVRTAAFDPTGRWIASAGEDDTVRLWRLPAGTPGRVLATPPVDHTRGPRPLLRFAPDGRGLLWKSGKAARIWDLGDGDREARVVWSAEGRVGMPAATTADGGHAVFKVDLDLLLRDLVTGQQQDLGRRRAGQSWDHGVLLVDGDRHRLLQAESAGKSVLLWDLDRGTLIRALRGHESRVTALTVSPDARFALSGSEDHSVRLWDLTEGRCLRTYRGHTDSIEAVHLDLTAGEALSVGRDSTVRRWELPGVHPAPPQLARPRPHTELSRLDTEAEDRLAGAERAIGAGEFGAAFDLLTQVRTTPGHERAPRTLAAWRSLGRSAVRTGLRGAWPVQDLHSELGRSPVPFGAADLSADGGTLITSDPAGRISVYSTADSGSQEPVLRIDRPAQFFNPADGLRMLHGLSVRADGRQILTISHDGVARLWSATDGDLVAALEGQPERTLHAQFGPDGRRIWIADARGAVFLWDPGTGALQRVLGPLTGSGPMNRSFYADSDGRRIAAGIGGTVRLRDHEHGAEIHLSRGPYSVRDLGTSTDGRLLLTAGSALQPTVRVWDIESRACTGSFDAAREHKVARVRLLADGRYALSGGDDGAVRVWDVATGRSLRVLEGHRGPVHSLAVTSDGRFVMSASGDLVRLWELDWEWQVHAPGDWDDGARPHLEGFLFRFGNRPEWTEADFEGLMQRLQDGGYGWLRKDGVRAELGRMTTAATEADSARGTAGSSLRERLRRRWSQRAAKGENG